MKLTSQMKNLSEEIITSFKQRIQKNDELVVEVQKTLEGFRKGHQEMVVVLNANAKALKESIASGEKERLIAYKELITDIDQSISSIKNATSNLLSEFDAERAQMTAGLKEFFVESKTERLQNDKDRIAEFDVFLDNLKNEVSTIFTYTNDILDKFHAEHQEMSAELRADLIKTLAERVATTKALILSFQERLGEIKQENQASAQTLHNDIAKTEAERISSYNSLKAEILAKVDEIRNHSAELVSEFAEDRKGAEAEWNNMATTLNELRKKDGMLLEK